MYDNEIYSGSGADNSNNRVYNTGDTAEKSENGSVNAYQGSESERSAYMNGSGSDSHHSKKEKKHGRNAGAAVRKVMLSISLGLLFGLFAGLGFFAVQQGREQLLQNEEPEKTISTTETVQTKEEASPSGIDLTNTNNITVVDSDISSVVEEVMPAMVSIVNNFTETGTTFFGQTYSAPGESGGSGIIVKETEDELLLVTNYHVVADADKLTVLFYDDSTAEAHIKGTDADMDLAVIAVPLSDLSEETKNSIAIATLGNSDNLKLGEPVIAIGNALGYGQSVTNGIVSALNREITLEDGSQNTFIQTNAAINHGNSGGALLNVNGEVVGINSNKLSGSSIEGMGYAIPISAASPIIAELMERETRDEVDESERGYLGITLQEVTREISAMYKMPRGVYVISVEEGSGAKQAGVMSGDIITKFDGQSIDSYNDLQKALTYFAVGDTAKISVMRPENGQYVQYDLEVTLGERPEGQ